MTDSLRIRVMIREDLPFADLVRRLAGWNQSHADWDRFLATEPNGCFIAEHDGARVGTATTTVYGPTLAWIGMLLVHPEFRRRGIGRALLEQCLEHLRARGVSCVKLDATPPGRKIYGEYGFKDEWTLTRWEREGGGSPTVSQYEGIRSWRDADAETVESLDAVTFGASRRHLLRALANQGCCGLVAGSEKGSVGGYGLLRKGSIANYLGPVVAKSSDTALQLVEFLLERAGREKVIWDIPDHNAAAVEWAGRHGFVASRTLTRMYRGENSTPGDPRHQFAIAGPEIG